MKKDEFFNEAIEIYNEVISQYEKLLGNFQYEIFSINDYEKVFLIQDSFIVYIGLYDKHPHASYSEKCHQYIFFRKRINCLYKIFIEELTENKLFKFVGTKFTLYFEEKYNINAYDFFTIYFFYGIPQRINSIANRLTSDYINQILPNLELRNRLNLWEGTLYFFVVFEVYDNDQNRAFCVWNTSNLDIEKTVFQKCKDIQKIIIAWANASTVDGDLTLAFKGILFDNRLRQLAYSIKKFNLSNKVKWKPQDHIKYIIIKKFIKNSEDIITYAKLIYQKALNGEFDNSEKGSYTDLPVLWKSEFLVKVLCEKIYGKQNVIYQYRPFFLNSNKGQMSYDIFISKKNTAIEYQGRQHFEPIDFFGGLEAFKKQKERDALKRKISENKNIKLIYINYWEKINEDLIKEKVDN